MRPRRPRGLQPGGAGGVEDARSDVLLRSISEISSCFSGRDPGTLKSDIVSKKTSTINLFGFETLKLKIRRLKLWKPTVSYLLYKLFSI